MTRELNASIVAVNSAQTYAEYVKALTTSDGNFSADKYISARTALSSYSMTPPSTSGYSPVQPYIESYSPQPFPFYGSYEQQPRVAKTTRKRGNGQLKTTRNHPYGNSRPKSKKKISEEELNERLCRREDKKRMLKSEFDFDATNNMVLHEIPFKKEEMSYADEVNNAVAAILCDPDKSLVDRM